MEVTTIENGAENEPPSAPTSLTGKAVSPYQNELTWAASSGNIIVAGYNVYRDGVKVGATSSSKLSYSDTGLAANSTYTYEVKAVNQEGLESLASNSISVKTKPAAAGEGPLKAFLSIPLMRTAQLSQIILRKLIWIIPCQDYMTSGKRNI